MGALVHSRIEGVVEHALRHRVYLGMKSEIPVDFGFGFLPFELEMIRRAVEVEVVRGVFLRICTADDLCVMKAFASRHRDIADLETILVRQRDKLDLKRIRKTLVLLADGVENPELVGVFDRLVEKVRKLDLN